MEKTKNPAETEKNLIETEKIAKNKKTAETEKTAKTSHDSKSKIWWKKCGWVVGTVVWVFVAIFGVQILLMLIAGLFLSRETLESTLFNSIFSVVSYFVSLALIILLPPKILKGKVEPNTRERLGLRGLPTWTDLGLGVVGYVVTLICEALITMVFELFPFFNAEEAQDLGYTFFMPSWEKAVAFVAVAIIAPIVEELIFRGWLYGKMRIKVPKWLAIFVVSLLFGLVHMQWNVGVGVFAMSVVSCIIREITGTIYAGTLTHMINNSVAFILVYVIGMQ